jgi:hypothetical protein
MINPCVPSQAACGHVHAGQLVWDQQEFLGGDFRFQISDFTSDIPTIQHTLHFYATTPIKPDHPPWRESDDSEFIIRSCKFPGCNPCTLQYSEVEQPVRLFNAIKSKMKIKIGGRDCEI